MVDVHSQTVVDDSYAYLDYAATAPLCEEAASAMAEFFVPGRGGVACEANANSLHTPGRAAFAALERARSTVARAIGARRPSEIVFTSGATESDNAALVGIARAACAKRVQEGRAPRTPRIVTSSIEHDAVLEPARRLASEGFDVVFVAPTRSGFVEADAIAAALNDDTVLVSVQAANSEIGAIQPVADIARAAHDAGALFHTDATQALGKAPVDVEAQLVDAASFSAHKIGGPKGVGALYLRMRTPFAAQLLGGGQEAGARSGTQNVCGAVGFAAACEAAVRLQPEERARLASLRDRIYRELSGMPRVTPTVDFASAPDRYLPNIAHVCVAGMESETIILRLDLAGVGISGGSACSSNSLAPSHVLRALSIDADLALGAVRVSMGRFTTEADIDRFVAAFRDVVSAPIGR